MSQFTWKRPRCYFLCCWLGSTSEDLRPQIFELVDAQCMRGRRLLAASLSEIYRDFLLRKVDTHRLRDEPATGPRKRQHRSPACEILKLTPWAQGRTRDAYHKYTQRTRERLLATFEDATAEFRSVAIQAGRE